VIVAHQAAWSHESKTLMLVPPEPTVQWCNEQVFEDEE